MQTLKVSVSLPGDTHPDLELHLSANDSDCDVVIALPLGPRSKPAVATEAGSHDAASTADDDYALGGYAGI
jgi:hypothetical protein